MECPSMWRMASSSTDRLLRNEEHRGAGPGAPGTAPPATELRQYALLKVVVIVTVSVL